MPVADVDLEVSKAEVGLVDASADDELRADGKLELFAVEPDRAGAIGEK